MGEKIHAELLAWIWTNLENPEEADIVGEFIFVGGALVAKAVTHHRGYVYYIGVVDERSNAK